MARWYIIHAYSGFEGKVRDSIMAEATRMGLEQLVEQIEVPTETTTEARRGKKIAVERKFMPGYVLAKLNMNDDVYHLVKNTPKVTGFLGSMGKPQPISETEAARMLNSKDEAAAAPKQKMKVDYEISDSVKVLDGPFASFNGIVEELDFDRSRVKVSVSIFGRATPVELEFEQVERAKEELRFHHGGSPVRDPLSAGHGNAAGGRQRPFEPLNLNRLVRFGAPTHYRVSRHGKKDNRLYQAAGAGGQSKPVAADRPSAWPAWREHHGILQGVQRADR